MHDTMLERVYAWQVYRGWLWLCGCGRHRIMTIRLGVWGLALSAMWSYNIQIINIFHRSEMCSNFLFIPFLFHISRFCRSHATNIRTHVLLIHDLLSVAFHVGNFCSNFFILILFFFWLRSANRMRDIWQKHVTYLLHLLHILIHIPYFL